MTGTSKMSSKQTPPWKERIESVLAENMKKGSKDSLNIQLATMPLPGSPARPSVRTVVYRGFAGQPRKPDEPDGGNPTTDVTSDLMIVSSDTRMLKARQILAQQQGGGEGGSDGNSCNGFEVCWWHQGTQEQFRLSGRAWLLTPPDHDGASSSNSSFPGDRLKAHIDIPDGQRDAWSWEGERRRQFSKHSPALRGSFRAPCPGSELTKEKAEKVKNLPEVAASKQDAESEEERAMVEEAMAHFSLVVLEMEEVEYLKVDPPPSRTRWTLDGDAGWTTHEISP